MPANYDAMGTPRPDAPPLRGGRVSGSPNAANSQRQRNRVLVEETIVPGGRSSGSPNATGYRYRRTYGYQSGLGGTPTSGPTTIQTVVPGRKWGKLPGTRTPDYIYYQRAEGADVGRYTALTGQGGTGYYDPAGQSPPVGQNDILPPEEEARRARLKAMANRRRRGRAYTTALTARRANVMTNEPTGEVLG